MLGGLGPWPSSDIVIIEVKKDFKLKDVYQTKLYAEALGAKYAFLVFIEKMKEELRRFLFQKPEILAFASGYKSIILLRYLETEKCLFSDKDNPSDNVYKIVKDEININ